MARFFAYCRVSTTEQTTANQILAIRAAGYDVSDSRVVSEVVSGSREAMKREAFNNLITNKLEAGDSLVVLKLDRLGRDNIDVQNTVIMLSDKGINLICLDLPVKDLSSSESRLMLQMFSAFAEFERNRIRERTQDGLQRARAEGKKLGRPQATRTTKKVLECKERGMTQTQTTRELSISLPTVKRHWNK